MDKGVNLGNVEMLVYSELHKDVFMHVEEAKAVLHSREHLVCVLLELCIVDEIEK